MVYHENDHGSCKLCNQEISWFGNRLHLPGNLFLLPENRHQFIDIQLRRKRCNYGDVIYGLWYLAIFGNSRK